MKSLKQFLALALFLLPLILSAQTITPIANIQDSMSVYENDIVTIEGVVTIGAGKLAANKAYIQDNSGKGIQLYGSFVASHAADVVRGTKLRVTGKVLEYGSVTPKTTEITDITSIEALSQPGEEQYPIITGLTMGQICGDPLNEGIMTVVEGTITDMYTFPSSGDSKVTITDASNFSMVVYIESMAAINISNLSVGIPVRVYGVFLIYATTSGVTNEILLGYQDDISITIEVPIIQNVSYSAVNPIPNQSTEIYYDQAISLSATIIDYVGTISSVKAMYRFENSTAFIDTLDLEAGAGNVYACQIPQAGLHNGSVENYFVKMIIIDSDNNTLVKEFLIVISDKNPIIKNISAVFYTGTGTDDPSSLNITANVYPISSTLQTVKVRYTLDFSNKVYEVTMERDPSTTDTTKYIGKIAPQGSGIQIFYSIYAKDSNGLEALKSEDNAGERYVYVFAVTEHKAILKIPPKTFNPYLDEKMKIGIFAADGDRAILRIYSVEGKLIETAYNGTLSPVTGESEGIHYIEWDGRTKDHKLVPLGVYICHLEVRDATGHKKTAKAPVVVGAPLK